MAKVKSTTIPEYIRQAPKEAQKHLKEIYSILKKLVPEAREVIKWGYPIFEENRILFSFAAFRSHMNFMPGIPAITHFKKDLEKYKTGKGTVSFPYDKPLPKLLIRKIASYRAREVRENDVRWM